MRDADLARWAASFAVTGDAVDALRQLLDDRWDGSMPVAALAPSGVPFTPPRAPPVDLPVLGDHLDLRQLLGRGGMGEVHLAHDSRLKRDVALKVLLQRHALSPALVERFVAEARAQANLVHPGILAVYDIGVLADGRPYFTMELQRGQTLRAVFDADPEARPSRVRESRVARVRRACEIVAFAHGAGVVHRDLKPANIMVGRHGEVQIVDWGLHQQESRREGVLGTPNYMAPEQARGERVDTAADVYALGALLFEAVTGRPPIPGGGVDVLQRAREHRLDPLPGWCPDDLAGWIERALSAEALDRPAAEELAQGLSDWFDGAERRRRARGFVREAHEELARAASLREQASSHAETADRLGEAVPPSAPVEAKRALWEAEDASADCLSQATAAEDRHVQLLHQALSQEPRLPEALDALADFGRSQLLEAEERHETRAAARAEARLRAYQRGQYDALLEGTGALSLHTDPPAEARLHRLVLQERRLVPVLERSLGTTPLQHVPLDRGSYLVTLHAPDHVEVRLPVAIRRQEHADGVPPDATTAPALQLPTSAPAPDTCFVPPGWFWFGVPEAEAGNDAWPLQRRWEPGFWIQRFPVTNRAYLRFLDDLVARGEVARADRCAPRARLAQADSAIQPVYARDSEGRHHLVPDGDGDLWDPDWPVIQITWEAARSYAAWLSEQTGLAWDLPTETQWEKAARGVDARTYPWGEHFDATYALVHQSFPERPNLAPVYAFEADESPYGVRWMAGGVREWCRERHAPPGRIVPPFDEPGERLLRGGCWHFTERTATTTVRSRLLQSKVSELAGFRLIVRP